MPEVNLLQNTENPDNQKKRPPPSSEFELSEPGSGGVRKFFQAILGRDKEVVPVVDSSRMGMGERRKDQRILKETKSARPSIAPLPDADEVFDVNLLSEELVNRNRPRQQLIKLLLVAGAAVLVIGLAYAMLELAQRQVTTKITKAREELQQVKLDISKTRDDQNLIADTVKKLAAVQSLIDRHIKWTNFFSKLETYTLQQVRFGTSFSGDINGNLTLSARTNSFENLAKQYLLYQQAVERGDFISHFTISSATRSQAEEGVTVTFTVAMQVLPAAFLNDKPATIPEDTTINSITSAADFVVALCYLRGNESDVTFFPAAIQSDLSTRIQNAPAADCQNTAADDLTRVQAALRTDADNDGLNSLLEKLINTLDQASDTDGDSQTDMSEFLTRWKAEK